MTKKRSPREIIEGKERPHFESVYVKFPGKEMENVSMSESFAMTVSDGEKIDNLIRKNNNRRYTDIHNHPSYLPFLGGFFGGPIPSSGDFVMFLDDDKIKTMVVAQNNAYSGKLEGYGVYKKTKKTSGKKPNLLQRFFYETATSIGLSKPALNYYVDKFEIKHRFVPAKHYRLNNIQTKFIKSQQSGIEQKKKSLEDTLSAIIGISGVVIGLFLISSNLFSGNVQLSPGTNPVNWQLFLGIGLLIIGLVAGFFWFKRR